MKKYCRNNPISVPPTGKKIRSILGFRVKP